MTKALVLLLEQKPATLKNDLEDWAVEKVDDKNILFFKGKNYIPQDNNLRQTLPKHSMIMKQQDTPESWRHLTPFNSTTGGLD